MSKDQEIPHLKTHTFSLMLGSRGSAIAVVVYFLSVENSISNKKRPCLKGKFNLNHHQCFWILSSRDIPLRGVKGLSYLFQASAGRSHELSTSHVWKIKSSPRSLLYSSNSGNFSVVFRFIEKTCNCTQPAAPAPDHLSMNRSSTKIDVVEDVELGQVQRRARKYTIDTLDKNVSCQTIWKSNSKRSTPS